ncbi:MAG: HEAT repeat domain-containing protein, partial [Acidobacteriota bacterium]|nr:HEAT repeat domain-containing protein [Acidobacteriota bacterium]
MFSLVLLFALSAQPLVEGNPIDKARSVLQDDFSSKSSDRRAHAVRALGNIPGDSKAKSMAESALTDGNADVRVEAAIAVGELKGAAAIPKLKEALKDKEIKVVVAVANALYVFKDPAAYQVYYALLTGERKSSDSLVQSQLDTLKDRKQMEKLAFETGIGFVPFGGMGWEAWKTITQNDSSPVKAAAAEKLAKDPDPKSAKALVDATFDKKWQIRAAAANAIGIRGD